MSRCSQLRGQLEDVALGVAATPELSRHLIECAACAAEVERQRSLVRRIDGAVHAIVRAEPPPQLPAGVAARLTAPRRPAVRNTLRRWPAALALAAVCVLIVGFGYRAVERPPASHAELAALSAWRSPTASLLEPLGALTQLHAHPYRSPGATHDS